MLLTFPIGSLFQDLYLKLIIILELFCTLISVFLTYISLCKIYSDNYQTALKYLKDTEANLCNILIIASNFNIIDINWDILYPFHLVHSDVLFKITDSFNLTLLIPVQQVLTRYSDNDNNSNSVIDLCFLHPNSIKLDSHIILPELRYPSDHAPLVVNISIIKEFIQDKYCTIIKNSKEEEIFIVDFISFIRSIGMTNISDKTTLDCIVQEYLRILEITWYKHSK